MAVSYRRFWFRSDYLGGGPLNPTTLYNPYVHSTGPQASRPPRRPLTKEGPLRRSHAILDSSSVQARRWLQTHIPFRRASYKGCTSSLHDHPHLVASSKFRVTAGGVHGASPSLSKALQTRSKSQQSTVARNWQIEIKRCGESDGKSDAEVQSNPSPTPDQPQTSPRPEPP